MVLDPKDLLISLDVVSLCTGVPMESTSDLLAPLFLQATVKFFELVLKSTYFAYNWEFYEQIDGVVMGSMLSPVVADFFHGGIWKESIRAILSAPPPNCPEGMWTILHWSGHMDRKHWRGWTPFWTVCMKIHSLQLSWRRMDSYCFWMCWLINGWMAL